MRISDWSSDVCSSDLTVRRLARGLAALGVRPGDRVVLVSENRPEWAMDDLAIMAAGAVTVPAYTTNTEIGRASCRERVCQSVEISVVAGALKKKRSSMTQTTSTAHKY